MSEIGIIPTKTSVGLRYVGGQASIPEATPRSAGVMTAQHVQDLEWLMVWTGTQEAPASLTPQPPRIDAALTKQVQDIARAVAELRLVVDASQTPEPAMVSIAENLEPVAEPTEPIDEPDPIEAAVINPTAGIPVFEIYDKEPSRLLLALGIASAAAATQVDAGDYRWHGGDADFVWTNDAGGIEKLDAYEFVEFCKMKFNGG